MSLSTHVLDTATGRPAAGMRIALDVAEDQGWQRLGEAVTDPDGRVRDLLGDRALRRGKYRLVFDTGGYHAQQGFYPDVTIAFVVSDADEHYHVPLLLSPFGYATYRGS